MFRITTSIRFALAAIMLLFATACRSTAQDSYSGAASYQQFYDELSPYGEWINDPQYGYVWVPDAGNDFRPYYSNGYWANTDYGNTWVSDYDWGWAPFHYGRWTYSSFYGWAWIPGNEWGPAWVTWRSGGGCYGWAPMGPGVSVNFSFGSGYYVPDYWWNFTPQQYILDRNFHNYSYGPRYNSNYIHQTTIINNTYVTNHRTYVAGPRHRDLEIATGRPVQSVSINNINRPNRSELRSDRLNIYRPSINESRPGSTERPRSFRAAEHPLPVNNGQALEQAERGGNRPVRNGTQGQTQDHSPVINDRPLRNHNELQPQRTPGPDRNNNDRGNVQQPGRAPVARPYNPSSQQQIEQPQQNRNEWNNNNRTPIRQPQQQVQRDQQQIEQQRAQQQQQQVQQRAQQQQMQQQRAQQQQMQQQQRSQQVQQREQQRSQQVQQREQQRSQEVQQPRAREERIEQPRSAPASQPVREQRAPDGGGEGRRHPGR